MTSSSNVNPLTSFFEGLISKAEDDKKISKPSIPDTVIDPDYNLAIVFAAIGTTILTVNHGFHPDFSFFAIFGGIAGALHLLLAALFGIQASRVRFVFDSEAFELKMGGDDLQDSGENIVVGGKNRWDYSTFVNWEFFPNVDYPILVYFKETQTPKEKWGEGPGGLDKKGGGQVHFFPVIGNAKQLEQQFLLRDCAKL